GMRAAEDERLDRFGLCGDKLLRDHPAQARAEDMGTADAGLVEHLEGVAGHRARRVRPGRLVRLADAAVVERDHAIALGEHRDDRVPAPARVAEPLDQEQRLAVTVRFPGDLHDSFSALRRRPARAMPPGRKKTTRMKSTPSTKSGCCSGVRSTEGSDDTA